MPVEGLYNGLHRAGQTLETDAAVMLPKRPLGNSNPNPNAFENFGSTLRVAPSSSQAQSKSKPKSQRAVSREPTRPITIKKPLSVFFYADSEDELDFLSSSQADPDDYNPSNKKASASQSAKYADGNGKHHDYDPKFPVRKSQVLAKLKFTKTKNSGAKDNATMPSSCSLKNQPDMKENSQDFGSWVNDLKKKGAATGEYTGDDDILEISSPLHPKSSNQRLSPPQSSSKQPIPHRLPDASLPARPRPKPLPLPRPACKPNAKPDAIFVDGHELIPLGRAKTTTITKEKVPSRSSSLSISTPKTPKKRPLPKPRNNVNPLSFEVSRELSSFPMPSPQSNKGVETSQSKGKNKAKPFPLDDFDENEADEESECDEGKRTAEDKGKQKQPSSSSKTFPMDMISPLGRKKQKKLPMDKVECPSFKASRKLKAFPMPSPQSSDKASMQSTLPSKRKNKVQSIPKEGLSKHRKRMSEGRSDDDERQAKKKRRSSLSPSQYNFEDEGDSLTISPDTDPRTLCPYCDTPLPSSPSQLLINILAATRKKSTRDPRPSNPLGLKAPLAIFIVVCQRHKFESQILPEAERKEWPKIIQWTKLGARVERMKDELRALIEDPGGEHVDVDVDEDIDEVERLFRNDGDGTRQNGSKARSIFWTEVMDEVKKKGSRAVVGVQGQFSNFEKTQPGYYGEQGSVIIHQTLFDMFPPASFDPKRILPLTSNEFILRILVPEVALRLIMEDRDLEGDDGMHEALIVLRESSTYGVAMFPEDGGGGSTGRKRKDDAMWVGDKIVMERARKRRKELEEEEEQEEREEARRIAEIEAGVETRAKKMGSKKRKGKQREEQQLEDQPPVERPRPRPRPVAKASSSMSVLPLSGDDEQPQMRQPHAQLEFPPNKGITRSHSLERSDSTVGVNFYDGDEEDHVNLEIEDFYDIKTPVRRHSRSSDHRGAKNISDDEQTPKPSILPLIGGSNDNVKPLMIARSRQSQKNDSESKFGEADMPRQLRSNERAPNLRAIRIEDTTDAEVESSNNYSWLLNDSSQSSKEGKSTSRRRH